MQAKQMHVASPSDQQRQLEKRLKAQAGGFLLVPIYLVIIAWVLRALGWW